jgi:sugar phosphate isomerase/epimerase
MNMKKTVIILMGMSALFCAHAERPFFAFDNGLTSIKSVEEQAKLLKELGYAGICTRPDNCTDELLAAFDKHGVKIMASYVVLPAGEGKTAVPSNIIEHFKKLKGRGTVVWFSLNNSRSPIDPAVELTRNVCDAAAENGLSVVFYPHVGCLTSRIATCEKIRALADRKNLGLSLTLCHFLAQNDHKELEATLKAMAPNLKLVLINGANMLPAPKADWNELIKPLGEGTFDMERLVKTLDEIGYDAPVGLQCYKIPGSARDNLAKSMQTWKKLNAGT